MHKAHDLGIHSVETLKDEELDAVTGGGAPLPAGTWQVQPVFESVFSRYVLGRYTKQPE
jgi:hypothetical protein